jgi:hypothetical protein
MQPINVGYSAMAENQHRRKYQHLKIIENGVIYVAMAVSKAPAKALARSGGGSESALRRQ